MQYSATLTPGLVRYVESELPHDLERRLAAKYVELAAALGPSTVLYLLNLAGGGDGHTFVVEMGATNAPVVSVPGAIVNPRFICYLAAEASELPLARQVALNRAALTGTTGDEQVVGASQGARFMGIMVIGTVLGEEDVPVPLPGPLGGFAILAGTPDITNGGPTAVVGGDVGIWPAAAINGFPPGTITGGVKHQADVEAAQAQLDLTAAYLEAEGRVVPVPVLVGADISGTTFTPGTYKAAVALGILSADITLNALGNPNAVFLFQIGSALTVSNGRKVNLINGAKASNVFWQVGSSAALGTTVVFNGVIMALTSITLNTGATVNGRLLARNGTVTLLSNSVVVPAP